MLTPSPARRTVRFFSGIGPPLLMPTGYDDLQRHRADRTANYTAYHVWHTEPLLTTDCTPTRLWLSAQQPARSHPPSVYQPGTPPLILPSGERLPPCPPLRSPSPEGAAEQGPGLREGRVQLIPCKDIAVGDLVRVLAGQEFPCDSVPALHPCVR